MNQNAWRLEPGRQYVMGVINLAPESFASQGRCSSIDDALFHAEKIIGEGVDIIDIGAEPTNPSQHSPHTSESVELDRLIPVIEGISSRFDVPLSVDTSKPRVMEAVVTAGAGMINDIRALRYPEALETCARLDVPVCLMHMSYPEGVPEIRSHRSPDIVTEVRDFLRARAVAALDAGIKSEHIILDPGFGAGSFGKNTEENLALLKHLEVFQFEGYPLLVGVSHKTFIGDMLNCMESERVYGSLAVNMFAAEKGVEIIRTHDVRAMVDVMTILTRIRQCTL